MLPVFPEFIQSTDLSLLDAIQSLRCAALDLLMPIITSLGNSGIIWIAVAVIMLFFRKTRKTGIMMGVALIIGLALGNGLLKNIIGRTRPYDITEIELLVKRPHDLSFPSGHTLASFEAATVLMLRDRRFGIPALVLAVLIAFSRLYLYLHFPSDVVGGALLGILFGFAGVLIVNLIYKKYVDTKGVKL